MQALLPYHIDFPITLDIQLVTTCLTVKRNISCNSPQDSLLIISPGNAAPRVPSPSLV